MDEPQKQLKALMARGCNFLGTAYAIMGGAMTWVSERNLVSAISNAGGFGVLACGSMTAALLRAEIQATRTLTDKPFGVNLIVMHPDLEALAQVCVDEKVSHTVLAGGLPKKEIVAQLKQSGGKVMALPPTLTVAKRMVRNGIDALIIEGMEAGGHIGPVSLNVLAQEILPHMGDVPVFVAGGIGRGESIVAFLEMGAAGAQLGTRFVVSDECIAHPAFKEAFVRASARDAVATTQLDPRLPVMPVRALVNEGTQEFMAKQREVIQQVDKGALELAQAQLEVERFWAGSLRRAVRDGDIVRGSVMAGQSVGMITAIEPVDKIVEDLVHQAVFALKVREGAHLPKRKATA